MNKFNPKVTIITPVFNREEYIAETINSVLKQNYPNLEYIVVNDGSTDGSLNVIRKFRNKVKIIDQKNKGETAAVNIGLKFASGDIIGVLSSDDILLPDAIKEIVRTFRDNSKILVVYPDWKKIDKKGKVLEVVKVKDYDFMEMIREHYCMLGPGTFFKKDMLKFTKGRNPKFKYIADFAFWLKLGMYGPFLHLPKTLAGFRIHDDSQGISARGKAMAGEHKKLVDWIYNDPDLPEEAHKFKREAYASAYYHAAKESGSFIHSLRYYASTFFTDPVTFFRKVKYELVKVRS